MLVTVTVKCIWRFDCDNKIKTLHTIKITSLALHDCVISPCTVAFSLHLVFG